MNLPHHSSNTRAAVWVVGGGVQVVLIGCILRTTAWFGGSAVALTLFCCLAGACLLATLWATQRHATTATATSKVQLGWIIAVGIGLRLICFTEPPRFETDFHRFLWDGAMVANGFNPYASSPAEALSGSPSLPTTERFTALARAGKETLGKINHPDLTTIYPPVAQGFFAAAYWIRPFSTEALRAVFLLAELGILVLLLSLLKQSGRNAGLVILYWWNPVAVKEFYVGAHMDALATVLAVAALATVVGGWRRSGLILLGLAAGVKLWPIILAPVLLRVASAGDASLARRSRRSLFGGAVLLAGVTAACTWPLMLSWAAPKVSGLSAYAYWWTNNAGLFGLVEWALRAFAEKGYLSAWFGLRDPVRIARIIGVGLVLVWMAFLLLPRLPDREAVYRWCMCAVGGMFLVSPTQFPWYYTWLLPFLVLSPARGLLLYTAVVPLYHLQYDYPWALWAQHLPVWALVLLDVWRWGGRGHRNAKRPPPLLGGPSA